MKGVTDWSSGGQSVKFWTTGRQSKNGSYSKWVYCNYLLLFYFFIFWCCALWSWFWLDVGHRSLIHWVFVCVCVWWVLVHWFGLMGFGLACWVCWWVQIEVAGVVGFGCGLCCRFFFFFGWLGVEVMVGGDGCSCGRDCDCG